MKDSKSYQKMAKNFNKTKKATWSKILLGLRSVQINEIHSALKDKKSHDVNIRPNQKDDI